MSMSIKNRLEMAKEEPNNGGKGGDDKLKWQWRGLKGTHTQSPKYNKKRCTRKKFNYKD